MILEPAQQARWVEIVGSLPPDWFGPANFPLLRQLVRHIGFADDLTADISRLRSVLATATDSKELRQAAIALQHALRAHGFQSQHIASLSGKLRLTQRSKYARADAAYSASKDGGYRKRPWEDW
jgi:hypothetical protein